MATTETTFAAALREEQMRRRSDRLAKLAILLPQARMALQTVEGLRASVRQAIGTDSRVVAMNVLVDFAVEMLDRFAAACEAEQMAGMEPVMSDKDREVAADAAGRN